MPTAPPPPSQPEPRPARPLSAHEQRVLDALNDELNATDPDLAHLCRALPAGPRRRRWFTPDRIIQITVLGGIALLLMPASWRAMILVLGVVVAFPMLLVLACGFGPAGPPPRQPRS